MAYVLIISHITIKFPLFHFSWAHLLSFSHTISSTVPKAIEEKLRHCIDVATHDLLKEADWETCRVMHQAIGKSRIRVKDLKDFPCEALAAIDKLWREHSNGKFGFSAQAYLWRELNADDKAFDVRVGWRLNPDKNQKNYKNLTFNLEAPVGHLPAFFKSWGGGGWSWRNYLLSRFEACNHR